MNTPKIFSSVTLSMIIVFFLFSCKKKEDTPAPVTPTPTASEYYIKFKFSDSSEVLIKDGVNGASFSAYSTISGGIYGQGCTVSGSPLTAFMYFSKSFASTPTDAQLESLYSVGSYNNFSVISDSVTKASVSYSPNDNDDYSTNSFIPQTNSILTITSVESVNDPNFRKKVKGTFNCKLYSFGSSDSLVVVKGEFTMKMGTK